MAIDIHFLNTPAGQVVLGILQGILDSAGPNFAPPYDSNYQPANSTSFNAESLIQMQLPGGGVMQGMADPGATETLSTAINSALAGLAPFISAYALILPILGVIRGIIEIICALLNPFAVIRAVIRLFKKWIPPFIALFPMFAGVIILLNIIKAIIAIIFYVLTVVIPTIELIRENIKAVAAALGAGADKSEAAAEAGKQKIRDLIAELLQQSGVLQVLQPIMEITFAILGLTAGFPCGSGKGRKKRSVPFLAPAVDDADGDDCSNCESCPEIISDRDAVPKGVGALIPSSFCDYSPLFVFKLVTTNDKIRELEQYIQSKEAQLEGCLDEPIRFAKPVGSNRDTSLIKVKITSRRGKARTITVPVLDIEGTNIKIISPLARLFVGVVNYEIEVDYEMMVMNGIMGVSCHPDVAAVANNVNNRFSDIDGSFLDNYPDTASFLDDYNNLITDYNSLIGELNEDNTDEELDKISGDLVNTLNDFITKSTRQFNYIASGAASDTYSTLEVNKTQVKADNIDKGLIIVTPKDVTGSSLLKDAPPGADIQVDIFSTFGTLGEKQFDSSTGSITAEISSHLLGSTEITAKVSGNFIKTAGDTEDVTKIITVKFVSDAQLPARRKKSKISEDSYASTGLGTEKAPGK